MLVVDVGIGVSDDTATTSLLLSIRSTQTHTMVQHCMWGRRQFVQKERRDTVQVPLNNKACLLNGDKGVVRETTSTIPSHLRACVIWPRSYVVSFSLGLSLFLYSHLDQCFPEHWSRYSLSFFLSTWLGPFISSEPLPSPLLITIVQAAVAVTVKCINYTFGLWSSDISRMSRMAWAWIVGGFGVGTRSE